MNDKPTTNDTATDAPEKLFRCDYCGKQRPAAEVQPGVVYRNGEPRVGMYCVDTRCVNKAQNSAEE